MVQLQILSGKKAGTQFTARRLPMTAGRSGTDLCLNEPGIWNRHFLITCDSVRGVLLRAEPDALVSVNGQSIQETVLRNGDTIAVGSVSLRFDLSPIRQSSLKLRETLTWAGLILLCVIQVALILQLARR